MLKTKKATREVDEVCSIVCNKCTKEYFVNQDEMSEFEGLGEVSLTFGFFSEFFGDMTRISFSLCEECLFELVASFKVNCYQEDAQFTVCID